MAFRQFGFKPIPDFGALLRRHFFAGLLILIPIAVIAWILLSVLGSLWSLHEYVPDAWKPDEFGDPRVAFFLNLLFTFAAAVTFASFVSIVGWASKQFLGQKILELIAEGIQRIPVIRSVYSALDQLLRTMAAGGGQQFNRVVYIEYPRRGVWALAFVTAPARGPAVPPNHLNVYVPTTPNPTSGFHLIVPESDVRESHLKVEDAFKTILSLGIAQNPGPAAAAPDGGRGGG
jgi:uncharacterized membrane protein